MVPHTSTIIGYQADDGEWRECECVKQQHRHAVVRVCPVCESIFPADEDHFYKSVAGRWGACRGCHTAHQSHGGKVGTCARWNVGRGKPCTCGQHDVDRRVRRVRRIVTKVKRRRRLPQAA